jgi:DNA polymerase-3 subunit alpha
MWNGRKPVFELRTAQGKSITATGNHPFRTLNGWTELSRLQVGDRIAAPRRMEVSTTASWPRHEIIALAGLISEGNTCHPTCLYFFGNDRTFVHDFVEAIACFPDTVARTYARAGGRRLEVCVSTGRDARFRHGQKPWNTGGGATAVAEASTIAPPARSGAFRWAERLGILGLKATEKRIPASVFRLRDADLELFLGRLWTGDGFIANATQTVPYYATSSAGLAGDVQMLLLRLGILGGVHAKQMKYRGGLRPGYTVHLMGEGSISEFARRLLPHVVGKDRQVEQLVDHIQSTCGQTSKDTVPPDVRCWVDEERRKAGLKWTELERQSGVCTQEFLGRGKAGKRGFRRSTVARLAEFFGSRRLETLASSDVFWDQIVSIEPKGEQDTYDLTVEQDHNFVADGLIVHNSHTAAYAQIGYQTAYLKANYTPEFMAALLTSEIEDGNKRDVMVEHIADARRLGADVLPPSVNASEADFTVRDGKIAFGLTAIKGCGRGAAEAIARARAEGGPFKDLFDFCERIDLKAVNKAALERLAKAGALDCLGGHRAQLLQAVPRALLSAGARQEDKRRGQRSLFDAFGGDEPGMTGRAESAVDALPDVPAWPETEKLKYEKEALDFYFSSHPLAQWEKEIRRYSSHTLEELKNLQSEKEVTLGGMLTQVRFMNTKKARNGNSRYVRCKLEDLTGMVECVMWPDDYVRYKDEVVEDRVCFVKATVERTRDEPGLIVNRILSIEQAQRELARGLYLLVKPGVHRPQHIDALGSILGRSPGGCPVFLTVRDPSGKDAVLKLGREYAVNPGSYPHEELTALLGEGCVKLG